jgi:molybdopterin converting factor small subunit
MKVRIKLYGTLRRLSQTETPGLWEGEISPGITINELLGQLGAGKYEANIAKINGKTCDLDEKILEESEIIIVTPFGGG